MNENKETNNNPNIELTLKEERDIEWDDNNIVESAPLKQQLNPSSNSIISAASIQKKDDPSAKDKSIIKKPTPYISRTKKNTSCRKLFDCSDFSKLLLIAKKREIKYEDIPMLANHLSMPNIVEKYDSIQINGDKSLRISLIILSIKPLITATLSFIVEKCLLFTIPFLVQLHNSSHDSLKFSDSYEYSYIGVSMLIVLFQGIAMEYRRSQIDEINSRTSQCLRGIVLSHIISSNYNFLKIADSSFVSKIADNELREVRVFIQNIPIFLGFPFLLAFICTGFYKMIGIEVLVILGLLFIFGFISALLSYKIELYITKNQNEGACRGTVIDEMTQDIQTIKANSWEPLFYNKFRNIRRKEDYSLKMMAIYKALLNCICFALPFISCCLIYVTKELLLNQTVEQSKYMVIILNTNLLLHSMITAGAFFPQYFSYLIGIKTIDNFIELVRVKPRNGIDKSWLQRGKIRFFSCTGCVEEDIQTHAAIDKIFVREQKQKNEVEKQKQTLLQDNKLIRSPSVASKRSQLRRTSNRAHRLSRFYKNKSIVSKKSESRKSIMNKSRGGKTPINMASIQDDFNSFQENHNKRRNARNNSLFYKPSVTNMFQIVGGTNFARRINQSGLLMLHIDVSLEVEPGEVVCLMGKEECGVSGVFLSLLEETYITEGVCEISGSISYISKDSRMLLDNRTLRDNIVLEEGFNKSRFKSILNILSLDISRFPGEEYVEVLENAANFTELEVKKIMLARFLYCQRDIYIFNDYFDFLDNQINDESLFDSIIRGFLKGKTILYHSNKEKLVCKADKIFVFNSGTIVDSGDYDSLRISCKPFFREILIPTIQTEAYIRRQNRALRDRNIMLQKLSSVNHSNLGKDIKQGVFKVFTHDINQPGTPIVVNKDIIGKLFRAIAEIQTLKIQGKIGCSNDSTSGGVVVRPLRAIFGVVNPLGSLFIIFLLIIASSLAAYGEASIDTNKIAFIAANCLAIIFRAFWELGYWVGMQKLASKIHMKLIDKIFNTRMEWFIRSSSNIIKLRVTKDQAILDQVLNSCIQEIIVVFIWITIGVCLLNWIYIGTMAFLLGVSCIYIGVVIQKYFIVASQVCQIESTKTSNLKNQYSRSISEVLYYREIGCIERFRDRIIHDCDDYQSVNTLLLITCQMWLSIRIIPINLLFTAAAFFLPLLHRKYYSSSGPDSNWKLVFATCWLLRFGLSLGDLIRKFTKTSVYLISVERIFSYLKHPQIEHSPSKKNIEKVDIGDFIRTNNPFVYEIRDLSIDFCQTKILKSLSLNIPKRGRIAIYGNEGAGKHTLMNILLGVYRHSSGDILCFGKNITNVHPVELRKLGYYLAAEPSLFGSDILECIDAYNNQPTVNVVQLLTFLGFYKQLKFNMHSIKDAEEWRVIKRDPQRKMQLFVNLTDFLSKTYKRAPKDQSPEHRRSLGMVNNLYEGLVAEMLLNKPTRGTVPIDKNPQEREIRRRNKMKKKSEFWHRSGFSNINITTNLEKGNENEGRRKISVDVRVQSLRNSIMSRHSSRIDSVDFEDETPKTEINTILNFLKMPVLNRGANVPWNMRKIVSIARAFVESPQVLFFDENALQIGNHSTWESHYRLLESLFYDSTMIALLSGIDNLLHFDYIVYLEKGSISEQGTLKELILNENSRLSREVRVQNPILYKKIKEILRIQDEQILSESDHRIEGKSSFSERMEDLSQMTEEWDHHATTPIQEIHHLISILDNSLVLSIESDDQGCQVLPIEKINQEYITKILEEGSYRQYNQNQF